MKLSVIPIKLLEDETDDSISITWNVHSTSENQPIQLVRGKPGALEADHPGADEVIGGITVEPK